MHVLVFRFIDICLLRAGPQDIPASGFLLRTVLLLDVIIATAANYPFAGFTTAFGVVLFGTAYVALVIFLLLAWRGLQARFVQTYVAVLGTDVVLGMLIMPINFYLISVQQAGGQATFVFLLWVGLLIWGIGIFAHILRHALKLHIGITLLISMAYMISFWSITDVLFGTPA